MSRIIHVAIWMAIILCLLQKSESRRKDWYETTTIYQVYTRSFKDTDGDGVGDIKGVHEKLDYIESVGCETVWVQAFFKSPMVDMGYDISDFTEVDPLFGTMDDLRSLIEDIHSRGMKIMIDFVPNHTSNESEWFSKSVKKEEPYTDFYVWQDAKGYDPKSNQPIEPNNWISVFGGSMWEWNEHRRQFYLHQFAKVQPDLNYRNPAVREAMKDVLRFWLNLGIDGFRVDAISHLVEDAFLRDNPWRLPELVNSKSYRDQIHTYNQGQEETYEVTHEWRLLLNQYKERNNHSSILAFETYRPIEGMKKFFGNETFLNMHLPLNIGMPGFSISLNATFLHNLAHEYVDTMPKTGVVSWLMSNHDNSRMASRCFPEFSEAGFMTVLLLPGAVCMYYGEEIRMLNVLIRSDQRTDPDAANGPVSGYTRDSLRSPMQWDASINAGFSKNKKPWLPVNPDYWINNVERQLVEPKTHLKTIKRLLQLRKSPVIEDGQFDSCALNTWLFMFKRYLNNEPPIIVIVNLGTELEMVSINSCPVSVPDSLQVHTASLNSGFNSGDKFTICNSSGFSHCSELRPKAGVVLTLKSSSSGSYAFNASDSLLALLLSLLLSLCSSFNAEHFLLIFT